MKKLIIISLLLVYMLSFFSCAPGPNIYKAPENMGKKPAGFFNGLWHGIIAPFSFIVSLFTSKVNVYEVINNGGWYNFGFIIGLSIIFGGSGNGTGRVMYKKK